MSTLSVSPSRTLRTLLASLAMAAILGLCFLFWRGAAADQAAVAPLAADPFDQTAAINLIGEQVPVEIDGFYLFVMNPGLTLAEESAELASKLRQAAAEHDFLGIIGPDPKRNHETLIEALQLTREHRLTGLIVIYLGPRELAEDVASRLGAAGAELRYVTFPVIAGTQI